MAINNIHKRQINGMVVAKILSKCLSVRACSTAVCFLSCTVLSPLIKHLLSNSTGRIDRDTSTHDKLSQISSLSGYIKITFYATLQKQNRTHLDIRTSTINIIKVLELKTHIVWFAQYFRYGIYIYMQINVQRNFDGWNMYILRPNMQGPAVSRN